MLEQLKEVVLEMELLMRDCCNPVMLKNESDDCNKNDSNHIIEETDGQVNTEKYDEQELLIRVDPCFRKVFSASFFASACTGGGNIDKRKLKKKVCLYKLKSVDIPIHYRTIFLPDMVTDNGNNVNTNTKTEFPVKVEPQMEEIENGLPEPEFGRQNNSIRTFLASEIDDTLHSKTTLGISAIAKVKIGRRNYKTLGNNSILTHKGGCKTPIFRNSSIRLEISCYSLFQEFNRSTQL